MGAAAPPPSPLLPVFCLSTLRPPFVPGVRLFASTPEGDSEGISQKDNPALFSLSSGFDNKQIRPFSGEANASWVDHVRIIKNGGRGGGRGRGYLLWSVLML